MEESDVSTVTGETTVTRTIGYSRPKDTQRKKRHNQEYTNLLSEGKQTVKGVS